MIDWDEDRLSHETIDHNLRILQDMIDMRDVFVRHEDGLYILSLHKKVYFPGMLEESDVELIKDILAGPHDKIFDFLWYLSSYLNAIQ